MFKCRLTKIQSTHNNLRSDVIEGFCFTMPDEGSRFNMFAKSLDPLKDVRHIDTSPVREIENHDTHLLFHTLNSTYKLELLP